MQYQINEQMLDALKIFVQENVTYKTALVILNTLEIAVIKIEEKKK